MWPFPMESVHPMVVHFPIALLSVGVGLDLLALLLRRPGLHRIGLWNLSLGTLAAGLTVWTGLRAADIAKHTFEIHEVMEQHEHLGIATLALGLMATSWRLAMRDRLSPKARTATTLASVLMLGTLAWGAHLGGRLVYEFGVGGRFGASSEHPGLPHEHHHGS